MTLIREYDGWLTTAGTLATIPIAVKGSLVADEASTLEVIFEFDPWDSVISFEPCTAWDTSKLFTAGEVTLLGISSH